MTDKTIIANLLSEGKENAKNLNTLVNYFGGTGKREVLNQIERERKNGVPILAKKTDGGGYYLPKDSEEIYEYLGMLNRTIETQTEVYRAIKLYADRETKKAL